MGRDRRAQAAAEPPLEGSPLPLQPLQDERRCFRNLLVYSFIQIFFAIVCLLPAVIAPFTPEEKHMKHSREVKHTLWYVSAVQGLVTLGVPCLTLYVSSSFFSDPSLSKRGKASAVANVSFACFVMNLFFIVGATVGAAFITVYGLKEEENDHAIRRVMIIVVPILWACAVAWNAAVAAACYKAYSYADNVSAEGDFDAPEAYGAHGDEYRHVPSEPRR